MSACCVEGACRLGTCDHDLFLGLTAHGVDGLLSLTLEVQLCHGRRCGGFLGLSLEVQLCHCRRCGGGLVSAVDLRLRLSRNALRLRLLDSYFSVGCREELSSLTLHACDDDLRLVSSVRALGAYGLDRLPCLCYDLRVSRHQSNVELL